VPFLTWCQRRYGDVFCIRLPQSHTMVVTADPAAVRDVFALPAEAFTVAPAGAILEPFLGARSLLLLDGERHRQERQLLGRAFHAEAMSHDAGLIAEATERDMATWPVGRPFPLRPRMQAITLDVIVQAVFGTQSPQMSAVLGQFLRACGSLLILNPAWRKDLGPGGHPHAA
jgi:cytochrome P450